MKTIRLLIVFLFICTWSTAQTFTATATQKTTAGATHLATNQTAKTTTTTTTSADATPDFGGVGCTCTSTVVNELFSSSFGFLAGGSNSGLCTAGISDSFDYNLNPGAEYNWYYGGWTTTTCSGVVSTVYTSFPSYKGLHLAHTHSKWTGTQSNCVSVYGKTMCNYGITQYCSNTNSPTLNPNEAQSIWAPSSPAYDIYGPCQWYSGAWHCLPNLALKDQTFPPLMGVCTVLPPQ